MLEESAREAASWPEDIFGPLPAAWSRPKADEQTLLTALGHFARAKPQPAIADFERLLRDRSAGRVGPREADSEPMRRGAYTADRILYQWLHYRAECTARQRERAWPAWAVFAYRYRGVCALDPASLSTFARTLLDTRWAYSLTEQIDEQAWLHRLREVAGVAGADTAIGAQGSEQRELAASHLWASWEAYRDAWEAHACRSNPCQPTPDAEPYTAADAFWAELARTSQLIGHRARFIAGSRRLQP